MQQDIEVFRASKRGGTPTPVVEEQETTTTQSPAPVVAPSQISSDLEAYRAQKRGGAPAYQGPQSENKPSKVGALAKSLFTAPATIIARPIQLGAELIMPGDNTEAIDRFSREKLGGIVAPIPMNAGDVKKDVGRGIQTVALGTGAPLAGGAAFGLGSSLEQGNDLLSVETAFNTVLGAGLGKAVDWVGKPLFNTAGKVIGVVTPQVLKDVVAKGANAMTKFAENQKLLGGIAAPLSETVAKGFQAVDDKAAGLFKGSGSGMKDAFVSQYPGLSKTSLQNRFSKIDAENLAKPTTQPVAGYRKATEIFKNAKDQGTDLADLAVKNGIQHDSLIEGGKYATTDTADLLRNDAMKTSHDLIRPALIAAEPGVQRVPVAQIREQMIKQVDSIPTTQITDAERVQIKQRIAKEYADNSAAAQAHPNGYSLTELHDAKIATGANGKYRPNGTFADNLKANQARQESAVFRKILEDTAPADIDIKSFNKAIQQKFQLADYLEALHGKKVPQGLVQKAISLFGKVAGAGAGAQIGGGIGGVAGYHMGGVLFNAFENLPNPLKQKYLSSIQKEAPAVFKAFQDYLGKAETERLMRLSLPAPRGTTAPELAKQQNRFGGVELGPRLSPDVNKVQVIQGKNAEFADDVYIPENRLPTIPAGERPSAPKGAVDVQVIEAPNMKAAGKLKELFDKMKDNGYISADKLPVIQVGKKGKKLNSYYDNLPSIKF